MKALLRSDALFTAVSLLVLMIGVVKVPHAAASVPHDVAQSSLLHLARTLAANPYQAPRGELPAPFAGLSYDEYRAIRPIKGRAAMLPVGDNFAVDLLPPGLYFPNPVAISLPDGRGGFREQVFAPGIFDFSPQYFDNIPQSTEGAGFSGLRLRHPLNTRELMDEVLVVQGASYFRAIGRAMAYGLSARAVALGTGGPVAEEFPRFSHLRLHPATDGSLRLEAVIDSPSLAGHLDMTLRPGQDTESDIAVTLMPRKQINDIGVAPLTSMFFKGPLRAAVADDYRPRVHDSNVLIIENGAGERLWRPLANPAQIQTSAFVDDGPVAFGLWQTPRRFEDYQDSEARYHDRPSAKVTISDDWGPGAVMLVEIPTGDEFMDNIVTFWRPAEPLAAGSEHRFAYGITWTRKEPLTGHPAVIQQSLSGREHDQPGRRRFVVDFSRDSMGLNPVVSASGGAAISGASLFPLPEGRGTRVTFLLEPGRQNSVDLRLVMRDSDGAPVGPVWLYRWTRARDDGV